MKKFALLALGLVFVAAPSFAASLDEKLFEEYNGWREPCQSYRAQPEGYSKPGTHCTHEAPAPVAEETPAPAQAPAPQQVQETRSFTIYFDRNSAAISEAGTRIVANAAEQVKAYSKAQVSVSGYASTKNSSAYNLDLSRQRAKAVAEALIAAGIDPASIAADAHGEEDLAVPTPDEMEMDANRRAVITFTGWRAGE